MPVSDGGRLVALALPPGDEFVAQAERAWAAGDAVLPLDPAAPGAVIDRLVRALRPAALLDAEGRHDLDPAAPPVSDGVRVVIATSGSTGEPKGAELTEAALEASARATYTRIGLHPDDSWLSCLPWQHIGGLQVLLRARAADLPVTVHAGFDVEAVRSATATLVSLVPTQLLRLLDAEVDLSRFRVVLLGGAAASTALLDRARAAGARVVTTYGMSETCGGCVYDGRPLDGVDVEVDDAGRISIGGPMLMRGYRLRPDLTSAVLRDGRLRTEDVGSWDGHRLAVLGRADDVVVTGGENVAVADVVAALEAHDAVTEAAVVAVPDDEWGHRLVACVAVAGEPPTPDEIRQWVRDRLGRAAAPRSLVVVAEIPRLTSGKPDRLALLALAQAVPGSAGSSQSAEPPSTT